MKIRENFIEFSEKLKSRRVSLPPTPKQPVEAPKPQVETLVPAMEKMSIGEVPKVDYFSQAPKDVQIAVSFGLEMLYGDKYKAFNMLAGKSPT